MNAPARRLQPKSEALEAFRRTARRFVQKEFAPHQARWRARHRPDAHAWSLAGRAGLLLPDPGVFFRDIVSAHGLRAARRVFEGYRKAASDGAATLRRLNIRCDLRSFAHLQERIFILDFPIFLHEPPGLTHHPNGRPFGRVRKSGFYK